MLNQLVDAVEADLGEEVEVAGLARSLGTTEYHLRRMFSALAGMTLAEYVRRRRMTVSAAEVARGGDLLSIAVRYGYGSTEAYGRAFRAVHGLRPADLRRGGGPLRTQPQIRFRLTVEGREPMDTRIVDRTHFVLAGHAARVPLVHRGANPHIQAHIAALPAAEHARLKMLNDTDPAGILQVTADIDPADAEGTELTYLHGVAVAERAGAPADLDIIDVAAGTWAVFRSSGAYPDVLQDTWAATATDWFPSHPWRLRPGPSIVAVVDRSPDFATATTELWLPIEPA